MRNAQSTVKTSSNQIRAAQASGNEPAKQPLASPTAQPSSSTIHRPNQRRTRRPVEQMIEAAPTVDAEVAYVLQRHVANGMRVMKWIECVSPEARAKLRAIQPDLATYIDRFEAVNQRLTA